MSTTLKQKYKNNQLKVLSEKLEILDKDLCKEMKHANLLIEAIEEEDLETITKIVEKLRKMKGKGVPALDKAISNAETEITKYGSGGFGTEFLTKIKGLVGIKNPVVKVTTFADALEQGLKQVPTILKNIIGDQEFLTKNLDLPIDEILKKDAKKKKILIDTILKALKPKGLLSSFKNVPYVEDMNKLVTDLTATKLKNLVDLVKLSNSGPSAQSLSTDVKDTIAGDGTDKQTTTAVGSEPTKKGQEASPGKDTTSSTPTSEKTPTQTSSTQPNVKKVANKLRSTLRLKGVNDNTLSKVVDDLINAGLDPEKLK